jgi:hypothetical protein
MKILNISMILALSVSAILFSSCSSSSSSFSKKSPIDSSSKRVALVIGVEDYAGDNDLIGIYKDVSKVSSLFSSWGFTVNKLNNSLNLQSVLSAYSRTLGQNDILIVYYSGHGTSIADRNGDERDGKDEALVLSNGIQNEFLIDDAFNLYLNSIKARKLIIIDSCHSGTIYKSFNATMIATNITPIQISADSIYTSMIPISIDNTSNQSSASKIIDLSDKIKNEKNLFKRIALRTKRLKNKIIEYNKRKELEAKQIEHELLSKSLIKDGRVKYLKSSEVPKDYSSNYQSYVPATALSGEFIFFGATQDNEKSIATNSGSIFTNAFVNKTDTSKTINTIYRDISRSISDFHPSLSSTNSSLRNYTMNSYLKMR